MNCVFCDQKIKDNGFYHPDLNACGRCHIRIGHKQLDFIASQLNERDNYGTRKSVYDRSQIITAAIDRYKL